MRILALVPFPFGEEGIANRAAQLDGGLMAPGVEVSFEPIGVSPAFYDSEHDFAIGNLAVLEAGLDAAQRGFDAVCVDAMGDPGVAALRSVLDIPVLGPGRTTYHAALMLGDRFSVLSQWGGWNHVFVRVARDAGLEQRLASVRSPNVFPDVEHLLAGKEEDVFPQLEATARECVEQDGADVIVLGSTTMHQSAGYLAERLPVPVINPGPLVYKLAEAIVALGLRHSRSSAAPPYEPRLDLIRAMVEGGRRYDRGEPAR